MKADLRRKEILATVGNSDNALPAAVLAEKLGVSRQVIVQDIAILRANGFDIISTNRGYILAAKKSSATRVFKCRHTFEQMLDEGYLIIGLGGRIEDIFVNHRVYGRITARLELYNNMHVEELYRSLVSGASKPLMAVTDGYHYHTVSAADEETLDRIESALRDSGYLIEI